MNLYPSKRKDNYDYKKRNTKGDEEMLFEKGLHQSIDRPETNRELTPYAKLSWKEKESLNDIVLKVFNDLGIPKNLKDNFYRDVIFSNQPHSLSSLLINGTYETVKDLVEKWKTFKRLSWQVVDRERGWLVKAEPKEEYKNKFDERYGVVLIDNYYLGNDKVRGLTAIWQKTPEKAVERYNEGTSYYPLIGLVTDDIFNIIPIKPVFSRDTSSQKLFWQEFTNNKNLN
jgi:hypothetical protein